MANAMQYEDVLDWVSNSFDHEKLGDISLLAHKRAEVVCKQTKDQWQRGMPVHFTHKNSTVYNGYLTEVMKTKARVTVNGSNWQVPLTMLRHGHKL